MAGLLVLLGFFFILQGAYPEPGSGNGGHAASVGLGTGLAGLAVIAALTAFYCVQRAKLLAREIRGQTGDPAPEV